MFRVEAHAVRAATKDKKSKVKKKETTRVLKNVRLDVDEEQEFEEFLKTGTCTYHNTDECDR